MYAIKNEAKSEREIRAMFPNTSLPKVWTKEILDGIGAVPIFETPKPTVGELEVAVLDGWEVDVKGNTVQKWTVRDMFSDYTNEEGVVVTKAEQEAEYLDKKMQYLAKAMEQGIESHINEIVKAKGYNSQDSIAKYLVSGNPFYTECTAISLWIGSVWVYSHQVQADVMDGIRTMPTLEELIAELPVFGV